MASTAMSHGALLLVFFLFVSASAVVEPAAYPVKWDSSQPLDDPTTHGKSLKPEAYPVKWDSTQALDDPSVHGSSFKPEAYPVKWDSSQPLDSPATHRSSFNPEAYPVKWYQNQPLGNPTTHDMSLKSEAYPVKWDKIPALDKPSVHGSSFKPEAYPVKWDKIQALDDPSAHGSSFKPEAYKVKWYMRPIKPPVKWAPPVSEASDVAETAAARGGHELHVEPGMLFLRKSLFPGAILPEGTRLAGNGFPAPRKFVSRAAADAIPFGYNHLDAILSMFRIPTGSKAADQIAATLRTCEAESPEPHTCATSQQAAAAFAADTLGTTEPRAMVTVVHGEESAAGASARYAVAPNGVARIGGKAVVPCHPMPYPYMVHYCHRPSGVEALRVELLTAAAGASASAIAMCHADTTSWDARYFQMLNATRGEEICHFMPRDYVLWLLAAAL